ncbi:hypothetical protein [Moorena sp. SIO3H5]|uniref:hypothetical protein n=1 Tax=Moorena sp. SIO3H5 TaxID=2607834 RepID=UPI0013BB1EBB|nr:hypothetical protein [Moorena sp. SIO3H5]NEO74600.1 hypothetical protein [Moorena sp. SIO3H5]
MQKVRQIQYTIDGNFYQYSAFPESLVFTLEISEEKTLRQAVDEIRQELANQFGGQYHVELNKRDKLEGELKELQSKIDVAKTKWENTQRFLAAQGIKTDASDFPDFSNYLLPSSQETVDAEIENEDNDDVSEYEM